MRGERGYNSASKVRNGLNLLKDMASLARLQWLSVKCLTSTSLELVHSQ